MKILALDPGRSTAYARFNSQRPYSIEIGELTVVGSGRLLRPCPMHLGEVAADMDAAIVEEVGARPMQGSSAIFTFGLSVGTILGALGALRLPVTLVTPQEWKRASRLGSMEREAAKDAARHFARELWPEHEAVLRVKKNHGMAEAALMARWFFLNGPGRDVPMDAQAPVRLVRTA